MSDDHRPDDPDDRAGGPAGSGDDVAGTDPNDDAPTGSDDEHHEPEPERGGLSDRAAFWISAAFATVLSVGSIALVSGRAPFFEEVLRVRPTVEGGGIAAEWVVGNTEPVLEWLIVLVHFADVVLGIFILVMVFLHWAAFRRLAARMQPPGAQAQTQETAAATDGGTTHTDRPSREGAADQSDGGDRQ